MIGTILNGKVLDYHYKKLNDSQYVFYIGDILVGQIHKRKKNRWIAINSYNSENERPKRPNLVDGFSSRYYASEYLLTLNRLSDRDREEDRLEEESRLRFEKRIKNYEKGYK